VTTYYATPGIGSPHHLAGELFRLRTGLKMTAVHYRGGGPAMQEMIGGQVPMMFLDTTTVYQHLVSGRLKAIGAATRERIKTMPDLPTFTEQGLKDFEAYAWQGLAAPRGTPPELIDKFNKALLAAMDSTAVKARMQVLGTELMPRARAMGPRDPRQRNQSRLTLGHSSRRIDAFPSGTPGSPRERTRPSLERGDRFLGPQTGLARRRRSPQDVRVDERQPAANHRFCASNIQRFRSPLPGPS
jgi:hypothetical protein